MRGESICMHAGHATPNRDRRRFIPVSSIVENVGRDLCESLPAAHALTGCDTTSSCFKIGKRTAYTKLVEYVKKTPSALKNVWTVRKCLRRYYCCTEILA